MKRKKKLPLPQRILFLVLALPLIFWSNAFDVFGAPKLLYLAFITLLVWLAVFGIGQRLKANLQFYFWLTLILLVIFSSWHSVLPLISFFGLRRRLLGAATLLLSGFIWLAVVNQSWQAEQLKKVSRYLLFVSLGVNLLGLGQALGLKYPLDLTAQFGHNTVATFGNPNYYGLFLVLVLPLALNFSLTAKAVDQLLGVLAFFLSLTTLIMVNSTGAYFGALAGLFVYSWFNFKEHKLFYPLLAATFILAVAVSLLFMLPGEQANISSRLALWQATGKVISQHLFVGVGPETLRWHLFKQLTNGQLGRGFEDAHNLILNYAASFGIFGLGVFLLFVFSILLPAWRQKTAIPFLAAVVGYLVAAQVNPEDIGSLPLFWFFLGLIFSQTLKEPIVHKAEDRLVPRLFFYPFTALICLVVLVFAAFTFKAELYLYQASITNIPGESLVYFKNAQKMVPFQSGYAAYALIKLVPFWGTSEYFNDQLLLLSEQAVKANPYEPQGWGLRGWLFQTAAAKSGQESYKQQAIVNLKRALALDPYDQDTQKLLAQLK